MAGRERLLLRDAPLRPRQRRLSRSACASKGLFVSISSGVKPADHAVIDRLAADGVGADYITIDIAHGHADSVRQHDRAHQAEAAAGLRDRRQRRHARGGDRPRELGRRRDQGRRRPGQGLHHAAEDRLRHRRLAALGAEVVRARGDQADHRRRRHPRPRRHRQERALRRGDGDDRLAVRRPRGVARASTVEVDGKLYKEYYGSASATSTRASTSTSKASASSSRSRASWPTRCARCARTCRARSRTPAARGWRTCAR